jgi:hypothetical protein
MVEPGTGRHQEENKESERKVCGKKEEIGNFPPIGSCKTKTL